MLKGLLILTTFFVSSCNTKQINWNPDFYIHDSKSQAIISEKNHIVYCEEVGFDEYASLSKEKIKELAEILRRAKLPRQLEEKRIKFIQELQKVSK
jgi:hypothetical protein